MRVLWHFTVYLSCICTILGCQSTDKRKGIADSCYQPLYWPSEACPPGKK